MDRIRTSMDSLRIQESRHELSKQPRVYPKEWDPSKYPLRLATDQNLSDQGVSTASLSPPPHASFTAANTLSKIDGPRFGHDLVSAPSSRASSCAYSCSSRNTSTGRSSSIGSSISSVRTYDSSPERDTVSLGSRDQTSMKTYVCPDFREPLYENCDKRPVVTNLKGGKAFSHRQQMINEKELKVLVKDDLAKEKRQINKDRDERRGKWRARIDKKSKSIATQAGSTSTDLPKLSLLPTNLKPDTSKTTKMHQDKVPSPSPNRLDSPNHELGSQSATIRSARGSQTESVSSEDATDWEDDSDSEDSSQPFHSQLSLFLGGLLENESPRLQTELSPMKSRLIEKLMLDFWGIFDSSLPQSVRQHGSSGQSAFGTTTSESGATSRDSSSVRSGKRGRSDDGNEEESDGNNERRRKRAPVNKLPAVPEYESQARQFACPFRKHDPRNYSIQKWPRCAEKPQKSIARLKAHLYLYHLIEKCPRCKSVFETEEALEAHNMGQERCEARSDQKVDGMTRKMKDQIQSRKKPYPGQTDSSKWEQIYKILFPNEEVPDPFFEPVPDHGTVRAQSPDSVNIAHYEAYLRRALPVFVRNALEVAVDDELQPIEAQLHRRMIDIIQEAQDQAFASFRDRPNLNTTPAESQLAMASANYQARTNIETLFQAPPPTNSTSFPELADLRIPRRKCERNEFSDSGYGSGAAPSTISQHDSSEISKHDMVPSSSNLHHDGTTCDSDVLMGSPNFDVTHLLSFDGLDNLPSVDGHSGYPDLDLGDLDFL